MWESENQDESPLMTTDNFHGIDRLVGIAAASLESLEYAGELAQQLRSNITERLADAEERFRLAVQQYDGRIEWRSAIEQPLSYVADEARSADLLVISANRNG